MHDISPFEWQQFLATFVLPSLPLKGQVTKHTTVKWAIEKATFITTTEAFYLLYLHKKNRNKSKNETCSYMDLRTSKYILRHACQQIVVSCLYCDKTAILNTNPPSVSTRFRTGRPTKQGGLITLDLSITHRE